MTFFTENPLSLKKMKSSQVEPMASLGYDRFHPPKPRLTEGRRWIKSFFRKIGPGFVTGAAVFLMFLDFFGVIG